jgi:hypothetical protein
MLSLEVIVSGYNCMIFERNGIIINREMPGSIEDKRIEAYRHLFWLIVSYPNLELFVSSFFSYRFG